MEIIKKIEVFIDTNNSEFVILSTFFLYSKYNKFVSKYNFELPYFSTRMHLILSFSAFLFISKCLFYNNSKERIKKRKMKLAEKELKILLEKLEKDIMMKDLNYIIEMNRKLSSSKIDLNEIIKK
jgi:hypothetical protein